MSLATSFDCIVSQVHIPSHDVQGNLEAWQKKQFVSSAIKHLRYNNPDTYICFTGHGLRPDNLDLCDFVYWEDKCLPLDSSGLVINMPAQFVFVYRGIEHALQKGFKRLLKFRGDSVCGIPNITTYCENVLNTENKNMLLSQQTTWDGRIGDCFMYGSAEILAKTWHENNKVFSMDGLWNTAIHFANAYSKEISDWRTFLKENISFRDTVSLLWSDLRWNYHSLVQKFRWEEIEVRLLDNTFPFLEYAWGGQWHRFDNQGNMIYRYLDQLISEREFYK